jgi:P pilus assembly chaperone PapD
MSKTVIIGVVVAICMAFGLTSTALAAGGLSVSGGKINATVSPGGNSSYIITVGNTSDKPMDIGVEVEGYGVSLSNDFVVLAPAADTSPYTARGWLTVSPASFHLDAGQYQNVIVNVNVPAETGQGGRYAIVMIQTIPSPSQQVATVSAVAARVLLTVIGNSVDTSSQITGIAPISATPKSSAGIYVTVADKGNYHYYPQIDVTLMNKNNVVATGSVNTGWPIIPGYSRQYQLNLTGKGILPAGNYEAKIEVEDGSGNLVTQGTFPLKFTTKQGLSTTSTTPTSATGISRLVIIGAAAGLIIIIIVVVLIVVIRRMNVRGS